VLTIGEAGVEGPTRFGLGVWGYSQRQDDIRSVDATGAPVRRRAQGAYALGEQHLFGTDAAVNGTAFLRIGVSDGKTTPFKGGWQAGVLVNHPIASRPDSAFSVGVQQGVLNQKFRDNLRDDGVRAGRAETGAEVTYSDKIAPRITLQPDLQWVRHAGGDRDAKDRFIAALRVKIDLSPSPAE
jgi:porin